MPSITTLSRPVLLLAGLLLNGCHQAPSQSAPEPTETARPAKIVAVLASGVSLLRSYPGTLEAAQQAELAFRVGGQLIELPAKAGQRVKQGELLARLDDAEYRNTLAEREARFELAKVQHEQARKLLKKNLSSQLQFDQAAAELKSAGAALDQARDNLRYTRLTAPFDGIVARVDVENYQAIQAKLPIIQLQNDTQLEIRFSVPESTVSQLKRLDDPKVIQDICGLTHFAAQPLRTYRACHKEHEMLPDPLTRNYSAVFALEPVKDISLLPGMSASIELDLSRFLPDDRSRGLMVPSEAVFERDGERWVWRVDPQMRARLTPVKVGRFEGDWLEIPRGIAATDRVIAAGVDYIREGMLVKPMIKERGL